VIVPHLPHLHCFLGYTSPLVWAMAHVFIFRADYWRTRADEARALAEEMKDSWGYQALQRIADEYDAIAGRARQGEAPEAMRKGGAEVVSIRGHD